MTINEVIYELNHRPKETGLVIRSFYRDSHQDFKNYIPIATAFGCKIHNAENSFQFPNESKLFFTWCETREDYNKFLSYRTKYNSIDLVNYELGVALKQHLDR